MGVLFGSSSLAMVGSLVLFGAAFGGKHNLARGGGIFSGHQSRLVSRG
jgi:hypothetical protein